MSVVITEDDPLNLPGKAQELKQLKTAAKLLALPRGGHLGEMNNPEVKALMKALFCGHVELATQR